MGNIESTKNITANLGLQSLSGSMPISGNYYSDYWARLSRLALVA